MAVEIYKKKKRYDLKDLHLIASDKGGKCLSYEYFGVSAVYKWECSEGHPWEATFGNILYNKTWCRACHVNERYGYSFGKLIKIADKHDVKLLDKEYKGLDADYSWECKQGHLTIMGLREFSVKGCEECKRPQKLSKETVELRMKEIGMQLLNEKFSGITKVYSWRCVHCKTPKRSTFKNIYYSNKGCLECKRKNEEEKKKNEIKEMAKEKGYEIIQFFGVYPRIECILRCEKKGHIRRGNYNMLKTKSRCAECANEKRKRYTIQDAIDVAKERGGSILSEEFNPKSMWWECSCGETWEATFYNVKNGTWCPKCSKNKGKRGRPKKENK